MPKKTKYDQGFEAGKRKAFQEAADAIRDESNSIQAENDVLQAKQDELMAQAREIDAKLWSAIDKFGKVWFAWATQDAEDIASYRVRGRIATNITIGYDDGYSFHSDRRIGGLYYRPVLLSFEHSDPSHVGSVTEVVQFYAEQMVENPTKEENEDEAE
jgi:hypothetical protein